MTNISLEQQDYMKKWLELNDEMSSKGFTWGSLYEDEEYHQYMSFNLYEMKRTQWNDIQRATEQIGEILNKTYQIICKSPEMLQKIGLPELTMGSAKVVSKYFSYFTRLDLIVNGNEIKLIEVNCDTPTGYLETSVANTIICREHGERSPNHLEDKIEGAWRKIVKDYRMNANDKVYFTSFGEHEEDKETVLFNMRNSGLSNVEYIAVEDLYITDKGVYDTEGNLIKYLYRLYPLEFLIEDLGDEGVPIGKYFLDHVESGTLQIINPPSSFVMQSKAVMALVWELYEEGNVYTFSEKEIIRKYFLPTYYTDQPFMYNSSYVSKPIFGREGGGVQILDGIGNVVEKDTEDWYSQWGKIYQEYIEMPEYEVDTWDDKYKGRLLVGSFLIGGEMAGLFLRVGEKITGNLSMFCGVTVK